MSLHPKYWELPVDGLVHTVSYKIYLCFFSSQLKNLTLRGVEITS